MNPICAQRRRKLAVGPWMLSLLCILLIVSGPLSAASDWRIDVDGDYLRYTPPGGRTGEPPVLVVLPLESDTGRTLREWFPRAVGREQARLGKPVDNNDWSIRLEDAGIARATTQFTDAESGNILTINYRGTRLDNGNYLLAYLLTDPSQALPRALATGLPLIMQQATDQRIEEWDDRNNQEEITEAQSTEEQSEEKLRAAILTAPGEGVQEEQLETVWLNVDVNALFGGLDVTVSLLFKDGTLYHGCEVPFVDLDRAASELLEPRKWSIWRRAGNGYEFLEPTGNGDSEWVELAGEKPVKAGHDIAVEGKFTHAKGSQYTGASWKSIRLTPDRRFEVSSRSMYSSALGSAGDAMPSVHQFSSSSGEGSETALSINSDSLTGGSRSRQRDGARNLGTYRIDGYVIERQYDDGSTSRDLFLWASEDHYSMIVGNTSYAQLDDE